jgi:hypothetical protein
MKYKMMTALVLGFGVTLAFAQTIRAAPFNAADKNPNVVAYYPTGPHGIVGIPGTNHEGADLVMKAGKSGNFQQWFYGTNPLTGETYGVHSIWNVTKNGKCPANATLVENAYPGWGDYLQPGADYCVIENIFKPAK